MPAKERQPGTNVIRLVETEAEKQNRLAAEDNGARLAAIEAALQRLDPAFKIPEPPTGLKRRQKP